MSSPKSTARSFVRRNGPEKRSTPAIRLSSSALWAADNSMSTIQTQSINDTPLTIAGKQFSSRFLLGTGKFKSKRDLEESIISSETEIVTVALRRIDLERHEENILEYIPKNITLLTNTSGARTA